jgi:hypothetical protein
MNAQLKFQTKEIKENFLKRIRNSGIPTPNCLFQGITSGAIEIKGEKGYKGSLHRPKAYMIVSNDLIKECRIKLRELGYPKIFIFIEMIAKCEIDLKVNIPNRFLGYVLAKRNVNIKETSQDLNIPYQLAKRYIYSQFNL